MRKRGMICLIFLFLIATPLAADQPMAKAPGIKPLWQTSQELQVPESVMHDQQRQVLYVSNIAGKPTEKNGKGFIAKVNLDGTIQTLHWVTGLNAPKGMGIFKNTLYVTDIDRIHAIDIPSGKISKTWNVEGAKFLNDIAIDPIGNVYISDMNAKVLYAIRNANIALLAALEQDFPNGMLMQGDRLLVGTAQGVFNVDPATGNVKEVVPHRGGIDGLRYLGDGKYVVSDWQGKVQIIEKGKAPVVLFDTTREKINAADLEYIPEKRLLLVPTFFDNRVAAYQLHL